MFSPPAEGDKDIQQIQEDLKAEGYETFSKTGDLYCLFYEKGMQLLKNQGVLSFITSNKWMRSGYGEKMRTYFLKYNPLLLIDLGPNVFKSATVDTNIILVEKSKNENSMFGVKIDDSWDKKDDLQNFITSNKTLIPKQSSSSWSIDSEIDYQIIEKMSFPIDDQNAGLYNISSRTIPVPL